jgi:hypothetical protein
VSDPAIPPRATLVAAIALLLSAFALVVTQIAAQDLPWWDEATYLGLGRWLLLGARPDFAWSPGYALTMGIARAALGPARAVPAAHAVWAAVFAAGTGLSARAIFRDARAALGLAAAALGTAHALVIVGPPRAAIALLLLAFAALASRRWPRAGLCAGAVLALAAVACRLEAAFAVPFLLPAAWAASPGAVPSRAVRVGWAMAFSAAAVALTLGAGSAASKRTWFAFRQHYAGAAYARDPGAFPPGFTPSLDYDVVARRDFPGATSVAGAMRVAPVRFGVYGLRGAATAVKVAAAALAPERFAGWTGDALVIALAVAVAVRRRRGGGPLPGGAVWLALGLAATSSGALLIVPETRHVPGLSLAMLFLLAAGAWSAAPRAAPFLAVAGVLTLASAYTLARGPRAPQTVRGIVARAAARPGLITAAGAGSSCFCAYLDACEARDDPATRGKGAGEADCVTVARAPTYFTSALRPSRPPCVTSLYRRIAVNPEVWELRQ